MSYTAIAALWVKETAPTFEERRAHDGEWLANGEVIWMILEAADDPWVRYQDSREVHLSRVKGPWVALKNGLPAPWPLKNPPRAGSEW